MKVGVFLVDNIRPTEGGGFSYIEKLLISIDEHTFSNKVEICFIGRQNARVVNLSKDYIQLSSRFFYKLFRALDRVGILPFFSRYYLNLNLCNRRDVNTLKKNSVDIVLYPKQSLCEIEDFPFISMNWDIGHKCTYPFPELILNGNFENREKWYTREIQKAFAVFVESESGKSELIQYLAYSEQKIHVVPIFAGRVVDMKVNFSEQNRVLEKFKLEPQRYFFYPAQFWAHKNHYNLILAFKELISKLPDGHNVKLILTGSDQGNKRYIDSIITSNSFQNSVYILGFLSYEEIYTLYKNSIALVMPSFFGPTNMPLLEGMEIGTAIICSDIPGHREICFDSAIYCNPTDSNSIAESMLRVMNPEHRDVYLERAKLVLQDSKFRIANTIQQLEKALISLSPIRKTFFY